MRCGHRADHPHVVLDDEQREPPRRGGARTSSIIAPDARSGRAPPSPRRAAGAAGCGGEGARQLEPLALAGGQRAGARVRRVGLEPARARGPRRAASRAARTSCAAGERADHHVVEHGEPANGRTIWKVRATPSAAHAVRRAGRVRRAPSRRTVARVGAIEAGDDVEERGLAGPVGPDDAEDLAGRRRRRLTSRFTAVRPPKRLVIPRREEAHGTASRCAAQPLPDPAAPGPGARSARPR